MDEGKLKCFGFDKLIFDEYDYKLVDTDPWPVTWPKFISLIGGDQQISSTANNVMLGILGRVIYRAYCNAMKLEWYYGGEP